MTRFEVWKGKGMWEKKVFGDGYSKSSQMFKHSVQGANTQFNKKIIRTTPSLDSSKNRFGYPIHLLSHLKGALKMEQIYNPSPPLTICQSWCGDGADHQRYHDHSGACDACQCDHDQRSLCPVVHKRGKENHAEWWWIKRGKRGKGTDRARCW